MVAPPFSTDFEDLDGLGFIGGAKSLFSADSEALERLGIIGRAKNRKGNHKKSKY